MHHLKSVLFAFARECFRTFGLYFFDIGMTIFAQMIPANHAHAPVMMIAAERQVS